jgi:Domain of unknown function (DUF4375)
MKIESITQAEVDAFPQGAVWNAFVHLLAFAEESELSDEQIPAWHAFRYESEVQNGGHMQYFLNRGVPEASRAVISLRRLGANEFANILSGALALWESKERQNPGSIEEYVEEALLLEFEGYDNRFGDAQPPLVEILERHLAENQELFVVVRED